MKKRKWTRICIGIYGFLAVLYVTGTGILGNYAYFRYAAVYFLKYMLLMLPLIYALFLGISNLRRYKIRYPDKSIAGGRALLIMYALALLPVSAFFAYKCDILKKPEVNPVFRIQKEEKNKEDSPKEEQQPYVDVESRPYGKVEDAYHKLYDDVLSISYSKSKDCYNAKGNFYALLEEGTTEYKGESVSYRITMVYDRISDDGKYHMFVNYREYMTKEGTVTEFGLEYYVNIDTGKIRAEEAPWGD